jgi:hypothetical protein
MTFQSGTRGNDPVNRSDQAGLDDDELPFYELSLDDIFALVDGGGGGGGDELPFYELSLDDIFALVDGGGGDSGFSGFLDVVGGGDDAFIEPIGPDPSLLRPILGQESIDVNAGDSFIDPFSTAIPGFTGIGLDPGSGLEPQNPQPITVRYMNKKYVKDFLKALQKAEKRLQKGDCAKLFGKSAADLVNMLENTEYRVLTLASGGPKYDPDTGKVSVTGAQTNSPTSVFINDKGPFFNQTRSYQGKALPRLTLVQICEGHSSVRCFYFMN